MKLLMEQLADPAAGDSDVVIDGRKCRVRRPSPGAAFTVEFEGDGRSFFTTFDPSAVRPETYPVDKPFVADTAFMAGGGPAPSLSMIILMNVAGTAASVREIEGQCRDLGWQAEKPFDPAHGGFAMAECRRGEERWKLISMPFGPQPAVFLVRNPRQD